jgi:hypothetical protein
MAKPPKNQQDGDYEVGYGKPPRHSRFKAGQKPPPRKPKKPDMPNLGVYLAEELSRVVSIPTADGRHERLPVGKLLVRQAIAQASKKGDLRPILPLLPKGGGEEEEAFSETDLAIIKRALRKVVDDDGGEEGSE